MTLKRYAELVLKLRTAQKANGLGYKTPAAATSTAAIEKEVDAATAEAIKGFPHNFLESSGS